MEILNEWVKFISHYYVGLFMEKKEKLIFSMP